MKILVIAPTPFFANRGAHIRILEEALALERLGHELTIATYHIGNEIDPRIKTNIDVRRIRRLLFWYTKLEAGPDWQKIVLDLMLIPKVLTLVLKKDVEVLHAHLHEGVLIGWIVQKMLFWKKIKLVADFQGSLTKEMVSHSYLGGGILKSIFVGVEKFIDSLGEAAISSSEENTVDMLRLSGKCQVETVLDGANLASYENLSSKAELKKELELPLDKVIVTYTGALMGSKGIQYLLDAMPEILKQNSQIFFVLAGFPAEFVEEYVQKNGLQENVRIICPLDYFELPKLLLASDIGVDPKDSSTGQASGKILGYMAAGLPVVCFDRENNHNYLGEGGTYAKTLSAQGLMDSILQLAGDEQQRLKNGEFNKQKVIEFGWDQAGQKIEKILLAITKA